MSADGNLEGFSKRSSDATKEYMETLLAVLSDPKSGRWDKIRAAETLAKEAEGILFSRKTGAPDFGAAEKFRELTAILEDPDRPESEKLEVAEGLCEWISTNAKLRES